MTGSLLMLLDTEPAPAGYTALGSYTQQVTQPDSRRKVSLVIVVYRKN